MKELSEELYDLGLYYLNKSFQTYEVHLRNDFYGEIKENIIENYSAEKKTLLYICDDVDLTWVKNFLGFPQISNLLIANLQYTLDRKLIEIYGLSEKKQEFVIGDITTHVLAIINEHFNDKSEEEIIIIKTFLEILVVSCSQIRLEGTLYDNNKIIDNKRLYLDNYWRAYLDKYIKTDVYKLIEKIKYELQKEFIPQNSRYNSIREKYLRALRQYYQMQFVYMLGDCKFGEFYIPPIILNSGYYRDLMHIGIMDRVNRKQYKKVREEWKHIFSLNDIIYIVGGPGFGKTLFLRYLINNSTKLDINGSNEYLVIYCDLKTFYTRGKKNKKSILDFLQESMIDITGFDEEEISKDFIQYYLDVGRCIVLLDALDEVPKEKREELHKKIVAFFTTSTNPNNKICITSRDRGFLPQGDIEVLEICPLTTIDIKDYLDKMIALKKFKKDDKEHFMDQAQILIEKNFLNNFLALSLLVSIYRSENKLPENKTNLYKKCFEYIAKERELEEKNETGFDWKIVAPLMKESTFISLSTLGVPNNNDVSRKAVEELLLEQYKIKFTDEAETECAIKEFLEFCSNRTDIFVPAATDDKFKFFHRSFFEYFYSRYIHQCATVEEMYDLMYVFDVDSEVFELTVALVKEDNETKYQRLVMYLFEKAEEGLQLEKETYTAFHILTLAMQVIDDAYFKQRYFSLVINNFVKLTSYQAKNINNKLVLTWIINAIEDKKDNLELFEETYGKKSIVYIWSIFSKLQTERISKIEFDTMVLQEKDEDFLDDLPLYVDVGKQGFTNYTLITMIRTAPFYVHVYKKYFNIYDKLESYNKMSTKNILKLLNVSSHEQRGVVRRGINKYKSFEPEIRMKLCDMLKM